ncbi:Aminopeptidase YpdE [Mucisphaera calidilacus]|uniref:Aminopeptidase YpdE n=1 Tax=Mucisphaera calidilacus TaxID=2527982 RepID=A0A518BUF5_9BACT|nr:Aminopeptidase YpdE [Mucisphaera calidilacus]
MSLSRGELALLSRVLGLPTSPFHEQNVVACVADVSRRIGWHARSDRVGNVMVTPGARTRPRLVLSAHMDHPGFWGLRMLNRGVLEAHWMGRVPTEVMPGQAVRFWSGGRRAREGSLPGFWSKLSDAPRLGGKPVDGVVRSVESVNSLGDAERVLIEVEGRVAPGSVGMWRLEGPRVADGRVHARAIDDMAAVAALLMVARRLARLERPPAVGLLFTRAEEGGFFGAIDYCRNLASPEKAPLHVGLEMSMARGDARHGVGVIVRVGDRRTTYSPEVTDAIVATAESLAGADDAFSYRRELMSGGSCESTVYQSFLGRAGAICLPLGNYHNVTPERGIGCEFIDVHDLSCMVRLCVAMAERGLSDSPVMRRFSEQWSAYADRHQHLYRHPDAEAQTT